MELRPYQQEDLDALKSLIIGGSKSVLFGAVTGYGKTVVIQEIIKGALSKGKRVLVLVPRIELVQQTINTINMPEHTSRLQGSSPGFDGMKSIQVAMVQTLHARLKTHIDYFSDFDLVVKDEAHLFHNSKAEKIILERYKKALLIGFSATPIDEKGNMLEGYDSMLYNHQAKDLISLGFLTDVKCYAPLKVDTSSLKTASTGDYDTKEVDELVNNSPVIKNVVELWIAHGENRKTVVFAASIDHAQTVTEGFLSAGIRAGVVHSNLDTASREKVLLDFKNDRIKVIVNIMILTTGWDCPSVECLVFARPTKSVRTFLQCIGRGLRLHSGKDHALILDMAGTIKDCGYPTMRRDFSIKKVDKEKKKEIEKKESVIECFECLEIFQRSEVTRTKIDDDEKTTITLTCPACGEKMEEKVFTKEEVKALEIINDPSKDDENVRYEVISDWESLEKQLSKAANINGKKYNHLWKKRVVAELQEENYRIEDVTKVIKRYTGNGWAIGGLIDVMKKQRERGNVA